MLRRLRNLTVLCLLLSSTATAQTHSAGHLEGPRPSDAGVPFYLRHYAANEYEAHHQNWAVTQDADGIIYVGNFDGILIYDGTKWELLPTPSNTTVRSLATDGSTRVYVGQQGDLGYLESDSLGRIHLTSLLNKLPIEERDFWDVWATHATDDYVYFQTKAKIFRWDGAQFHIWSSSNGYHTSFKLGNDIYVRERNVGLLRIDGEELTLIPAGGRFSDTQIYAMGNHSEDEILIATQSDGLFLYDGRRLKAFPTEADQYLMTHRMYSGTTLPGGYTALGLHDGGGLLILDQRGRIVERLDEETGLPDGWVNYVYRDSQGGLWLALNNGGVVRTDIMAPTTRYDVANGLEGVINDVTRHAGSLYVATTTGLFVLHEQNNAFGRRRFERVKGMWVATSLLDAGDVLLAAGHQGVYSVDGDNANLVVQGTAFSIAPAQADSSRFYIGTASGVSVLERRGVAWHLEHDVVRIGEDVHAIIEDRLGSLWLTTRSGKVYEAVENGSNTHITEYTFPGGISAGLIILTKLHDRIAMLGTSGVFVPDTSGATRQLHYLPYGANSLQDSLLAAAPVSDEVVWKVFADRVEIVDTGGEKLVTRVPEVLTFPHWKSPANVHVDDSGVAWISSGSTLVRYDPSIKSRKTYEATFSARLRRVTAIDSNRLLYGGGSRRGVDKAAHLIPDLPYANNALRFEFALPSYNDPSGNEYQYWLEGKDRGWSEWTKEAIKNYTNLMEGTYRFHLRGRNAQGYVSATSVYSFQVLPPWYRSTWAYGLYLLGFVGMCLFAHRYRRMAVENKRAKEQAKELIREREVNERLNDLNKRLQQANETLRQADRLKDEFLANTSHELRTPLTGILGCSAILREEVSDDHREFVNMIDENGQRLLNTLDSLLDLARLRAGLMELDFKPTEVTRKTQSVLRTYDTVARAKGVELEIVADNEIEGLFDDHCLDCVLNHLIGNAVKFTDDGRVRVSLIDEGNQVVVRVEDTGIGIDERFMPFLFDEFKQESTGLTRSHEGNGLGLAVTARIVDLMGGDIEVWSQKGVGSVFTVRLPLERPHETASGDGLAEAVEVEPSDGGHGRAAA